MTEDDLIEAIKKEDPPGLPEGKVLVTGRNGGGDRKYHTDPGCQYITDKHNLWDRQEAVSWGLEKCVRCDGHTDYGGHDASG